MWMVPPEQNGVASGSNGSRPVAEPRGQNPQTPTARPPFHFIQFVSQRPKQFIARPGDSATDDDRFGVENQSEGGNGYGKRPDRFSPDSLRLHVAAARRCDQLFGVLKPASASLGDGLIADPILQRIGHSEKTLRTERAQRKITEDAGATVRAA